MREYPERLIRALGLVVPLIRELPEVGYQFERPFVLDSSAAQPVFALTPTPWDELLAGLVEAYPHR